jgi:hypothetical protein
VTAIARNLAVCRALGIIARFRLLMAALDVFAILTAAVLAFSTPLSAIFVVAMVIAWIPFLDPHAFLVSLRRPTAAVPIAFFAPALVGTLWSDGTTRERPLEIAIRSAGASQNSSRQMVIE